ncbi:MAG: M42 family metallopeptidase [Clostridia bacterium]|nr:M42 family metallopeptidase [Clostridia bacterium]
MTELRELLKKLSLEFGPTGYDTPVRDMIVNELKEYENKFESYVDKAGAYIVHFPNEDKPKLMVSAHTDEVGFMITEICDNGYLRFGNVGGIDPIVTSSKRVISENGVKGAIISKPIHLQSADERKKVTKSSDMYIDIGCDSKEDAEKYVMLGDLFTFISDYKEFGDGFIKGKALDDRLGCAIMCYAIKEICKNDLELNYDLYFAFTSREEVGYSGAFLATEQIKPDYGFIIESTAVGDIQGAPSEKIVAKLGEGGAISFADRGTIYDRGFINQIMDTCKENGIKYQIKQYVSGGNDASNIQRSAYGVKVAVMSCPSRYIHSMSNVIHKDDLTSIYQTLMCLIYAGDRI